MGTRAIKIRRTGQGSKSNLGNAYLALHNLDDTPGTRQQAAVAFRPALEELSIEYQPTDWATAKADLGNALWELGEKTGADTYYIEQAIDAYHDALKVITPDLEFSRVGMDEVQLGRRAG